MSKRKIIFNIISKSIAVILFISCYFKVYAQEKVIMLNTKEINIIVDSLVNALKQNYVFKEKAEEISKVLINNLKKEKYNSITEPNRLASQLLNDINKIHYDGHFKIQFLPHLKNVTNLIQNAHEKKIVNDTELQFLKENNFMLKKLEVLPGNIGYFRFDEFTKYTEEAIPFLNAAFKFLSNTKALIIDLRNNGGGNSSTVNQFQNYFFDKKILVTNTVSRTSKQIIPTFIDTTKTNNLYLKMPLYILNSTFTASGAEMFSYNLQSLERAKIIGDKTRGIVHLTNTFYLGNGFVINIPFAYSINPYTNIDIEGIGITPDFEINSENALEKTLEIIYLKDLRSVKNEREKRIIEWSINKLQTQTSKITLDIDNLKNFEGKYVGFTFFVKENKLYCINHDLGGLEFELKPINDTTFIVDEKLQLNFIKNSSGDYSGINMLFSDGNIFNRPKL